MSIGQRYTKPEITVTVCATPADVGSRAEHPGAANGKCCEVLSANCGTPARIDGPAACHATEAQAPTRPGGARPGRALCYGSQEPLAHAARSTAPATATETSAMVPASANVTGWSPASLVEPCGVRTTTFSHSPESAGVGWVTRRRGGAGGAA